MVLMAVGDDDAAELILVLEDIGVIGQDEVDAGLGIIGEHQTGIDEDHVIAALENGHILADAVKTAERDDAKRLGFLICHGCEAIPFSWTAKQNRWAQTAYREQTNDAIEIYR